MKVKISPRGMPIRVICWMAGLMCFSAWADSRPNIVLIFMDDMGYNDIGIQTYPNPTNYYPNAGPAPDDTYASKSALPAPNEARLLTPSIDSLAVDGLRMTQFYTSPICSPARASLLSGRYDRRVNVVKVFNNSSGDAYSTQEVTVAEKLRELGYSTAMIGKWHLGYNPSKILPFQFMPTRNGFQEFLGVPFSNDMGLLALIRDETIIDPDVTTSADQTKLTWQYTEAAVDFIERYSARDKPFFLYMAHSMTHVPCWPSDREFTNADGTIWPRFLGTSGVSQYYDVVREVNHSVKRILQKLDDLGIADNTLIVFTSDNGPWLKRSPVNLTEYSVGSAYPLRDGKATTFEGGVRVPCLVRWPGHIEAGSVSDQVGSVIDLLPTFVHLAGGTPPSDRTIDGINLWPVWSGETNSLARYLAFDAAVRKTRWKLRLDALYDLENDIQETTDVSGVASNAAVLAELQGVMTSIDNSIAAENMPKQSYTAYEVEFSTNDIQVAEGGAATVDLRLSHNPGQSVTVDTTFFSGDADLSVLSGGTLNFNTGNWADWQTVTLGAAEDADAEHGGATFRVTMGGYDVVRELFVFEIDDEAPLPVECTLVWPKVASANLTNSQVKVVAEGLADFGGSINPVGTVFGWKKVSGPGAVAFTDASASETGIAFSSSGVYRIRLTADHPSSGGFGSADFTVQAGPVELQGMEYKYAPVFAQDATADTNDNAVWEDVLSPGTWDWALAEGISRTGSDPAPLLDFIDAAWNFPGGAIPAGGTASDLDAYGNNSASIEIWFKPGTLPVASPEVLWESGGDIGAGFVIDGSTLKFAVDDGSRGVPQGNVAEALLSPKASQDGFVHCIGIIDLDNDIMRLYVDGVQADSASISSVADWCGTSYSGLGTIADSSGVETTDAGHLGGNNLLPGSYSTFDGQVAHFIFYDRALSPSEVTGLSSGPMKPITPIITSIAPVVSAGPDQSVGYTDGAALNGMATGNGLLTLRWRAVEGSGPVDFDDESSAGTSALFDLPGLYRLWFEADDAAVKVYDETEISVASLTYDEWASGIAFQPGDAGADGNPDGDQWSNLWEWTLGLDPLAFNAATPGVSQDVVMTNGMVRFDLGFEIPRNREPNLMMEVSTNLLSNWIPAPSATLDIEILDDATERWLFSLETDPAMLPTVFARGAVQ